MSKQIISLVTAFLILFQLTPALAFSDTDGTEYEQAVYVLSELDIVGGYEDKTFRPAEGISRAEFAAMVVRMLDTSIYSISEEVVFKDVSKKHWAFEYVNAGYSIGYFSGYGDGTFNPEEKISFNEIVKTMVTILGYKPIAEAKGGYPSGYITVANELDILDGLSLGSSAYVTRGDVALLLYNCLDKPRLEQTGFGSDKIDYAEDERRTILTDELKVKRYEGVVTATRNTGIYTEAALGTDEILMGDTKLAIGKSDISAYLGYNLVVYAKEEAKTLKDTVLFYEINEENEITTVTADDIDPSTDLGTFCYWVDDEQEKINLADDVQVIINTKYEPFATSADLKPASGTVTLLSNDGTKDVDVIIVKKYSHYVVEKIDSVDLVIYDKYGKAPLELNPHGKEVDYQIFRKGSSARFKNISIGSVLSVMKSDDGEYVEIYIVASPVRGRISAVSDDGEVYIGDDGIAYRRSPDLPLSEKIEIGLDGVFYLDIEGNIISIDAAQSTHGNYCYLINAGIKAGMDSVLSFKVLNAKGDIEVLNACEKITFNGIKKTNEDILALLGGSGTITQQPLRYSKNADGELTKIEIPSKDFGTLERYYRRTTKMFGYDGVNEAFFVSPGDTVMFQVPPGGGDDDSYKVVKYDDFPVYDSKWTVTGYDLEGLTVGCTVLEVPESVQSVEITGTCCVLTEITTILNDDGDPVHKIYYMQDGKKQQKEISDKATLIHYDISISESADGYATVISPADLKPGDVFHTKTDSNGRINGIARVLSVGGTNLSNATHFLVSRGVSKEKSFGIVKKRIGTGMLLHVQGKGDYLYDITNPIGNLYMYDSRTKTASVIDAESILDVEFAPGDPAYAYVRCNSGELHDVIVFYQSK